MAENSRGDNRLMSLLVAGAIGAAVGVLVAPRAGKETREQIRTKINEKKEKIEGETQRFLRRGKDLLSREQDSVAAAIDAVKEAYLKEKESWDFKHS